MLIGRSIGFEHDNGHVVLSHIHLSLQKRKTALVGENGVGKSTLARLLAGLLHPTAGEVRRVGHVVYFAQFETPPSITVGEYLRDLWEADVDRRLLAQSLLNEIALDQNLESLSGGEWTRVRIARVLASAWDYLILDEPTNNLDLEARLQIRDFIAAADFPLLVISHDRLILREVDEILELSRRGLQVYGGDFDFYIEERAGEKFREETALTQARSEKRRRETERVDKIHAQEKRSREAARKAPDLGIPKILLGARKRRAQKTLGKIKTREDAFVDESLEAFQETFDRQKKERLLYFDLPETSVNESKLIVSIENFNFRFHGADHPLWKRNFNLVLKGPVRLALRGKNGAGKSTFIKLLLGNGKIGAGVASGSWHSGEIATAWLDQKYETLDPDLTVFENVFATSRFDPIETRNYLARFLFAREQVHQKIASLSGGEKLKAALAKALLQSPTPQLLILDEPTNHLDLPSLDFLEKVLRRFEGTLIVVSHDEDFLTAIGCTLDFKL